MTRSLILVALGFAACTPNNAKLEEGEYVAYFASSSSQTLFQDNVDFEAAAEGEDTYAFNIDCRDNLLDEDQRLENPLDICDQNFDEAWIPRDGYRAVGGTLDPWRGEAVITSEGDVQIGFHQRIPGGEDFRFAVVIDPNFQPVRCSVNAAGETEPEAVDGDWLANWSDDVDSGILYYLTNGAFQFNPTVGSTDEADTWTLPQEWRSGGAFGRIGAEDLIMRPVYYGTPSAYLAFAADDTDIATLSSLFYGDSEGDYRRVIADAEDTSDDVNDELEDIRAPITTTVHTNEWRERDESPAGLDGWAELHYSYIRFDEGTTFNKGDDFSGEMQLTFDARDSQTRVMVTGRFTVENLKTDNWTTDDIQAEILAENGNTLCTGNNGAPDTTE